MWTMLTFSIIITLLLILGISNHLYFLLATLVFVFLGNKIEANIFKNAKKPNKAIKILIILYFIGVYLAFFYKFYETL